jgi:hypothetical protein
MHSGRDLFDTRRLGWRRPGRFGVDLAGDVRLDAGFYCFVIRGSLLFFASKFIVDHFG